MFLNWLYIMRLFLVTMENNPVIVHFSCVLCYLNLPLNNQDTDLTWPMILFGSQWTEPLRVGGLCI